MIEIVDYQAGNLTSVKRALDFLGIESRITGDPAHIRAGSRIIFPGVGAAGSAVRTLKESGLWDALLDAYKRGTPILGICLGTQIILSHSEESDTTCLGIIPGEVRRFRLDDPALKIPHMGWNGLQILRPHPLLAHVKANDQFYFVHSYYPQPDSTDDVVAVTEYETEFPSVIARGNLFATQFHLEKSGPVGLGILKAFAQWEAN